MAELHHPVEVHNAEFLRINDRLKAHDQLLQSFIASDASHSSSLARIHEKLDEWKEQTAAITDLGYSMRMMVQQLEVTQENISKIIDEQQKQNLKIHDIENSKYNEKFERMERRFEAQDLIIESLKNKPGVVLTKYLEKVFSYLLIGFVGVIMMALWYYIQFKLNGG